MRRSRYLFAFDDIGRQIRARADRNRFDDANGLDRWNGRSCGRIQEGIAHAAEDTLTARGQGIGAPPKENALHPDEEESPDALVDRARKRYAASTAGQKVLPGVVVEYV
jgi:hypothetical protein